jgi:hypothetical protein
VRQAALVEQQRGEDTAVTNKSDPFQGDWIILDGCTVHRTSLVMLMERTRDGEVKASPVNSQIWLQHPDHTGILLNEMILSAVEAYKTAEAENTILKA